MTFNRRQAIVASCLAFFGFQHRSVRAATPSGNPDFLKLNSVLAFPRNALNKRWDVVNFDAMLSTPKGDKRLQGVLLKTSNDVASASDLRAFCTICPHEICHVQFVAETDRYRAISDAVVGQPLFVCPCHFSLFDPATGGEVIDGPALRGLYTFAFEVTIDEILVTGVEAGVLELLP
ncbi:MAG: Rieske 2Fe-2S domain-containing protein [Gammaproteobacteria bacterium]|nr:Rieske 2Fe-2S domain-containing protein [Gammaproteobacteria bacterium]